MDSVSIHGVISSLKAATEIAKSISDMKNLSEIQRKVIELQSALLEAQNCVLTATASQFEQQEMIRVLEAKLKERGDWEEQKERYQLVNPWTGPAQTYALKKSHSNGEEPHLICSTCFHNQAKVILNPLKDKQGFIQMACPKCKSIMDTGYRGIGGAKYAEEYAKKN